MWENEFRYLSQAGAGLMELDYLPSDKVYKDEHPNDDSSRRWLFYWNHSGVMDPGVAFQRRLHQSQRS